MIEVKGYRVLVKPKEIEKVSEGGIITLIEGTNEAKMEEAGNQFGTVVGIGETCWKGEAFSDPWCKLGDEVLFARHAGRFVFDPHTDEKYFIMNDTDILAVVESK